MKLTDFFRYGDLIGKIAVIWDGFRHTPVGGEVTVPRTVFEIGNQKWSSEPHQATRLQ